MVTTMHTRTLTILTLIALMSSTFSSTLINNYHISVQAVTQSLTQVEQDPVALANGSRAYSTDLQLENISSSFHVLFALLAASSFLAVAFKKRKIATHA